MAFAQTGRTSPDRACRRHVWSAAAVALVVCVGCGQAERSAASYCDRYESGFAKIRKDNPRVDRYENANPLEVLLSLPSAMGDITALIGDLVEVSPDEVQTDVERVHENLKAGQNSTGEIISSPLAGLASAFGRALTDGGAFNRMDKYTLDNCGEHMFSASPQQ
ncbi:MAG: hypothetical protein WKF96_02760 [Solirubrobacteraceae bacterium]